MCSEDESTMIYRLSVTITWPRRDGGAGARGHNHATRNGERSIKRVTVSQSNDWTRNQTHGGQSSEHCRCRSSSGDVVLSFSVLENTILINMVSPENGRRVEDTTQFLEIGSARLNRDPPCDLRPGSVIMPMIHSPRICGVWQLLNPSKCSQYQD